MIPSSASSRVRSTGAQIGRCRPRPRGPRSAPRRSPSSGRRRAAPTSTRTRCAWRSPDGARRGHVRHRAPRAPSTPPPAAGGSADRRRRGRDRRNRDTTGHHRTGQQAGRCQPQPAPRGTRRSCAQRRTETGRTSHSTPHAVVTGRYLEVREPLQRVTSRHKVTAAFRYPTVTTQRVRFTTLSHTGRRRRLTAHWPHHRPLALARRRIGSASRPARRLRPAGRSPRISSPVVPATTASTGSVRKLLWSPRSLQVRELAPSRGPQSGVCCA